MSSNQTTALNLTPNESTLYQKVRSKQRAGSWSHHLTAAFEHHNEVDTFRSLLTKLKEKAPYTNEEAKCIWVSTQLKTHAHEIKRFEKKYPEHVSLQVDYPHEQVIMLESRVSELEAEVKRLKAIIQSGQIMQPVSTPLQRSRSDESDRYAPQSPSYSPFYPPTTDHQQTSAPRGEMYNERYW